jgi:hypothetical protein
VAGCATPTGSAGHAGVTASSQLTFHLDHSMQAGQIFHKLNLSLSENSLSSVRFTGNNCIAVGAISFPVAICQQRRNQAIFPRHYKNYKTDD